MEKKISTAHAALLAFILFATPVQAQQMGGGMMSHGGPSTREHNAPRQAAGMTSGMMMHKGMMQGMWNGPMDMGGGMGSMQMGGES